MASALLTKELALQAIELVRPAIEKTMSDGVATGSGLHLMVLDPTISYGECSVAQATLAEVDFGGRLKWSSPYHQYAVHKADISWFTGLPSHVVQQRRPYLYRQGDIKYGGAAVYEGIVAAASGVKPWHDEMFAMWLAVACWGLAMGKAAPIISDPEKRYIE